MAKKKSTNPTNRTNIAHQLIGRLYMLYPARISMIRPRISKIPVPGLNMAKMVKNKPAVRSKYATLGLSKKSIFVPY
jgi:hypothetical protein